MRALMTATVASMVGQFNLNNIKLLLKMGYEVDVACNFKDTSVWNEKRIESFKNELETMNVNYYQIDFERNVTKIKSHFKSYNQIKRLIDDRGYKLIHTHTPISSLLTRVAYKNSKVYYTCRMIYTAHGFHFFKGNSPIKNLIFKTIEKYGAKYTDTLITINREDYKAAKKFKLKNGGTVEYVPGIGIDLDKINSIMGNKEKLCQELNIPIDSILLLSVGELSIRKNQELVIKSLGDFDENVHYLICGQGDLKEHFLELARENNIEHRLHLLGYCSNVIEIMKSCDIFIFPSLQEGLPVALMEALASGLPCIASDIRGNNDLITNNLNGFLFNLHQKNELYGSIIKIINNNDFKKCDNHMERYGKKAIEKLMRRVYE